jgi:argininosuccinate lyase
MPQKKNPDVLELVRAKASKVLGCSVAVSAIVKGLAGGYNRDLQETKEPFMEGLGTTRACLRIMALLVERLGVNRDALLAGFSPSVFAADWALELVAQGKSFRDAYHYVREHLDDLKHVDPGEAIALKTHLGAPAGLDLGLLAGWVTDTKKFVKRERTKYYSALSKLLGVRYPHLG